MVKKSENLEKSQKISKNTFFKKSENFENIFFCWKKKIYIIVVLPIEEIRLWPELSSPPRFRIQGGWSERYGRSTEILVSYIGYVYLHPQCQKSFVFVARCVKLSPGLNTKAVVFHGSLSHGDLLRLSETRPILPLQTDKKWAHEKGKPGFFGAVLVFLSTKYTFPRPTKWKALSLKWN